MTRTVSQEKTLTPRQYQAVAILVSGGSVADAAQAANVTRRTVTRWMERPEFREELTRAETETVKRASRRMAKLAGNALAVIEGVLNNPKSTCHERLRAASIVLESCLKWREAVNHEERLSKLEQMLCAGKRD